MLARLGGLDRLYELLVLRHIHPDRVPALKFGFWGITDTDTLDSALEGAIPPLRALLSLLGGRGLLRSPFVEPRTLVEKEIVVVVERIQGLRWSVDDLDSASLAVLKATKQSLRESLKELPATWPHATPIANEKERRWIFDADDGCLVPISANRSDPHGDQLRHLLRALKKARSSRVARSKAIDASALRSASTPRQGVSSVADAPRTRRSPAGITKPLTRRSKPRQQKALKRSDFLLGPDGRTVSVKKRGIEPFKLSVAQATLFRVLKSAPRPFPDEQDLWDALEKKDPHNFNKESKHGRLHASTYLKLAKMLDEKTGAPVLLRRKRRYGFLRHDE